MRGKKNFSSHFSLYLFYAKIVAMNIINLYENFNYYFNDASNIKFKAIFERVSKVASKSKHKLYLVGGIVRDMLLYRKSLDIDITVEGDAIKFANILVNDGCAKILSMHKDFGTVKVEIDGEKIDFASTRSETYPKKGHLPHVKNIGCSLEEDILRRDFTVNSLTLSLNQGSFADLIDYVGGFDDLKAKKIRILHDKSFVDDPTRIIRALKYATRLGFELEENTFKLQKEYLKNVNYDMCNKRVKNEIKKTFDEPSSDAFEKFVNQGIYKLLTLNEVKKPQIDVETIIKKYNPKHPWLIYLGLIAVFENDDFCNNFCDKLELTKIEKSIILNAKSLLKKEFKDDFELYKAFYNQKVESLLILAPLGKEKQVRHYLDDLSKIKLHINGNDLLRIGFTPSSAFAKGFDYVLKEKLQNPQIKKAQELKLIKDYLSQMI